MTLHEGTLLQGGKYKIVRFISAGGFGCTYEGVHVLLKKRVAIKEFFVKDFCNRDETTSEVTVGITAKTALVEKLKEKFLAEAQFVFSLKHPHIVNVHDVFVENGTAYYVMDYIDGPSLNDMVKKHGAMSEQKAVKYILQVADALKYVHSNNRLHLDVKPGNIMIDENDNATLIDFGTSKQYDEVSGENTSTLVGKTPGYAPLEQMGNEVVKFTPSTDIYSLGATLYKLLTGTTPPSSNLLASGEELPPLPSTVSAPVRKAVGCAMQINKTKRPQTIDDFVSLMQTLVDDVKPLRTEEPYDDRTLLAGSNKPKAKTEQPARQTDTPKEPKKSNKSSAIIVCIALAVLVCAAIGCFVYSDADDTFTVNGVNFSMVHVQGGTFNMGATPEQGSDAEDNEKPVHQVTLSSYYIGMYEVTQELWQAIMGSNPSKFKGDKKPVECVTWDDCQEFISKLNSLTGKQFRLPTEAEWEYACRGGAKSKGYKYSGSNTPGDVAWNKENSSKTTHDVGSKKPNELGIYDMSGNVFEWCQDWYADYSSNILTNPTGPESGSLRVYRGGSWYDNARDCRVSSRYRWTPDDGDDYLGLRLVISE